MLAFDELFRGTIDGASVYPREVVKAALGHNAAAVILGAQPSLRRGRAQPRRHAPDRAPARRPGAWSTSACSIT
ncbi:MAG: JAB domain-containing protein [Halofilum sp. (in: g-proteobacteria)]|nr:JAB domain-containing protein [Halofilum sp. (in: g-proteobacteria)]